MRFIIVLSVATLTSAAVAGPTKSQCIDANTQGQVLRKNGQLHAARDMLQTCVDASCPSIVRSDCQSRLDEIAHVMPSFVLESHDAPDKVAATVVTMDGEPVASAFGHPVEVDPGEHRLVFRAPGRAPIMRVVQVDEGVKARQVEVTFGETPASSTTSNAGLRVAGIALTAVGLVGLGLGSGFGVASFSAWDSVKTECLGSTSCDYSRAVPDRGRALDFATASDVAFVVGGVLAVVGVVLIGLGFRATPIVRSRDLGLAIEAVRW